MTSASKTLADARRRSAESATCVVDELLASMEVDEVVRLCRDAGVDLILQPGDVNRCESLAGAPDSATALAPVLLELSNGQRRLLMVDPWDQRSVERAQTALGEQIEPVAAPGSVWQDVLRRTGAPPTPPSSSVGQSVAPADVVGFVDHVMSLAWREGASDLHLECDRAGVVAKLRLDGVLVPASRLAGRQKAEEVISRVKVLAQLDITERRLPQDGRFRYAQGTTDLDLRVSIMPSVHGEDAVLRLLDKTHLRGADSRVSLPALGFDEEDTRRIRRLASLPSGLLLVTGPTGSGKTTTIYAALSEINTGREKLITIEDPVEYELPGVLQIPVNERKGLTFARGLRSILRHDPDRILVGEIRDAETAAIAIQSALTGHLVFTTVHANALFDVLGRFRHFDIDMFGFAWALNGVVVQRLLRRLCERCGDEREPSIEERAWLHDAGADMPRLAHAVGCAACHGTGYRQRFVVAEIHEIEDSVREAMLDGRDLMSLKRLAYGTGVEPLLRRALGHVRAGRTTLEEVFRVVGPG